MQLTAIEIWSSGPHAQVKVLGKTIYRIAVDTEKEVAHITAPGLDEVVELEKEIHPFEDAEAIAIMLIAQIEGGIA